MLNLRVGWNQPWISSARLSASLSPVETDGPDSLIQGTRKDFPPFIPLADPFETQNAICEAIARLVRDDQPEVIQLEGLFALERQAQPVCQLLLAQYVEGDGQIGSFEWRAWHSAVRLSRSLFQAYEYFLRHIWKSADENWSKHEHFVLVQLFDYRKVEFLLRSLRYKKRSSEQWRQLHEMYRFARERGLLDRSDAKSETEGKRRRLGKLEQQYLQILLLEAMNGGQFSPRETLWAYRWFTRWCGGPSLQLAQVNAEVLLEPNGFVVDISGSDGLTRASLAGDNLLYFDSSPLGAMIQREIAYLRGGTTLPAQATPVVRGQLALLNKLSILFAPNPANIERRALRKPVALPVQAIAGFAHIVEELWKSAQTRGIFTATAPVNEDTISPLGRSSFSPLFNINLDAGAVSGSITGPFDATPHIWQVKDRSDSGCRMRAQIDNLNLVIPGSLIAVRDNETSPWTVAVVRWFRRLMVDHVEIGVEYLGRKPRFVKMVAEYSRDLPVDESPASASRCFAALYLPPSATHPTMPIKTLLFPADEFRAGCEVTLLSSNATYRVRLNEPIQQQFEFIWTSFMVIDTLAPLPERIPETSASM